MEICKWAILAYNTRLPGYGSLGVKRIHFEKTVTWKIFYISVFCPKLKDECAAFWHLLKQKFQILISLERIHSIILLRIKTKPTTARLLIGSLSLPFHSRIVDFLSKSVAVSSRKINTGSDKTWSEKCFYLDDRLLL